MAELDYCTIPNIKFENHLLFNLPVNQIVILHILNTDIWNKYSLDGPFNQSNYLRWMIRHSEVGAFLTHDILQFHLK